MRRTLVVTSLGLVLVALPARAALHTSTRTTTIRLVSITTKYKVLKDAVPKGKLGKGDVLWAKSTLRNEVPQFGKPKGAIVGSDVSTLAVISQSQGDVTVTAKLPGGTLRAAGRIGQERVQRIPVTGGTGDYAGARGVAESTPLDASGDKARNVYRLTS